jgi:hypothetical protein
VHAGDSEICEVSTVGIVQCVVDFRDAAADGGGKVIETPWWGVRGGVGIARIADVLVDGWESRDFTII